MTRKQSPIELSVHLAQDAETGVWFVAKSDIPGLRVEGASADEIIRKVQDVAPDLIELNFEEICEAMPQRRPVRGMRPVIRPIFDTPLALAS